MKVLVAGSTGETGRRVVTELLERRIPLRAMGRELATAQAILPTGIELVAADLTQPHTLTAALEGCTHVICAAGSRPSWDPSGPYAVDFMGTKNLIDQAKSTGIQHFVLVTSLCVSRLFHPLNLFWLILLWKKQAELYLQHSGLTYTIIRPGGLKNEDNTDAIVMAPPDTLFEGRIPRRQVAQVCVESLLEIGARNKTVEIIAQPDAPQETLSKLFSTIRPS
ncbi:MAG: SDR family oxidoreductase [Cyanobacteriota bacterium]|nr:SDR family oxidoreductase [Cyanobacteriota bacterium]